MKDRNGFSLLELLIVVAIILIIATIAIPSLIKSRQAANEMAAVASLKAVIAAQVTYSSAGGDYGTLADLIAARLLDDSFNGTKAGYRYSVEVAAGDYTAIAVPTNSNSGRYGYYILPDGVVRYSTATSLAPAGQAGRAVH